jgi:crotonobetainyl-CoA:carnitine CoA-transferase CaiB-like acyl-CoA transferase
VVDNRLLNDFWSLAGGWAPSVPSVPSVDIVDDRLVLPSRLPVTELAMGSVAAASTAAAQLSRARGGPLPRASVNGRRVSAAFRSDRLFRLDGAPIVGFAELSGFWRTADGWVRTHANYPHHRERLLAAIGRPDPTDAGGFAAAVADRSAADLEAAVMARGGICVAVRSPEQWRSHPQDAAVRALPLVGRESLGDAPARRLPPAPTGPLLPAAGLRVLDLTRVIAGPVATRTLALLGADVLRLDSPGLPEISWQHLDTGMGKRSALLDLGTDRATFEDLLAEADVVVVGYRPHAVDRYGLGPAELAARRPGVVVATLSAWGGVGPWGSHRGFDSIVQAATGIAVVCSPDGDVPGALPAQALDHATGYLLAAAILRAVTEQVERGGSTHVHAHLARTASWLLDRGGTSNDEPHALPDVDDLLLQRNTRSGFMRYAAPAVELEGGPDDWAAVGGPWGADRPAWQQQIS